MGSGDSAPTSGPREEVPEHAGARGLTAGAIAGVAETSMPDAIAGSAHVAAARPAPRAGSAPGRSANGKTKSTAANVRVT